MRWCARIGLLGLTLALTLAGCAAPGPLERWQPIGTRTLVADARPVAGIREVNLATVGRLIITQGQAEALTIEAESNIARRITTVTQGNRLTIGWSEERPSIVVPTKPIIMRLTVTALQGVELSAAGTIEVHNLATDRLNVKLDGAGRIALDGLTADELDAALIGLANLRASGSVRRQSVAIDGAGRYAGEALQAATTEVALQGLGGAVVRSSDQLSVRINGAGGVLYYGNPAVTREVAGLGEVSRASDG